MRKHSIYGVTVAAMVLWLGIQQAGCSKDYSFEGADTATVTNVPPAAVVSAVPACALCHEDVEVETGKWRFKIGNTVLCGSTDNAGFIGTDLTFTFFGPSACSVDTGIVMTVYLPLHFDQDRFNIDINTVAFYYYDHFGTHDMFISRFGTPFTVHVDSYIAATRLVQGTFEGIAYKPNGDTAAIHSGRFKVKLK